jgi:hypothetical protein
MKKFIILKFLLITLFCQAQQKNYFIYFQSDVVETFTVKFKNKVFPSNAGGYLILSKLPPGENRIWISFQNEKRKEIPFICNTGSTDLGYKIISANDEIQLMNINDLTILKADFSANTEIGEKKKNPDTIAIIPEKFNEPLLKAPEKPGYLQPVVLLKQTGETGVDMVFVDSGSLGKDTIRLFVPVLKEAIAVLKDTATAMPEKKTDPPKTDIKKEEKFLDFTIEKKRVTDSLGTNNQNQFHTDSIQQKKAPAPLVLVNTDCRKIATNEEYLSLRKKIAGEYQESEMLKIAQKTLRQRCYLTEQIKNISVLFFTDENKFNFFRLAYPFIYDSEAFKTLKLELKDAGTIEKFNALIRK